MKLLRFFFLTQYVTHIFFSSSHLCLTLFVKFLKSRRSSRSRKRSHCFIDLRIWLKLSSNLRWLKLDKLNQLIIKKKWKHDNIEFFRCKTRQIFRARRHRLNIWFKKIICCRKWHRNFLNDLETWSNATMLKRFNARQCRTFKYIVSSIDCIFVKNRRHWKRENNDKSNVFVDKVYRWFKIERWIVIKKFKFSFILKIRFVVKDFHLCTFEQLKRKSQMISNRCFLCFDYFIARRCRVRVEKLMKICDHLHEFSFFSTNYDIFDSKCRWEFHDCKKIK